MIKYYLYQPYSPYYLFEALASPSPARKALQVQKRAKKVQGLIIHTSKETRTLTFKRKPIPKIGLATNYSILV
jgi:hypothetical protein